jgi:hypothetical protein
METQTAKEKLKSIRAYGGFPLQASQVIEGVESQLHKTNGGVQVTAVVEERES